MKKLQAVLMLFSALAIVGCGAKPDQKKTIGYYESGLATRGNEAAKSGCAFGTQMNESLQATSAEKHRKIPVDTLSCADPKDQIQLKGQIAAIENYLYFARYVSTNTDTELRYDLDARIRSAADMFESRTNYIERTCDLSDGALEELGKICRVNQNSVECSKNGTQEELEAKYTGVKSAQVYVGTLLKLKVNCESYREELEKRRDAEKPETNVFASGSIDDLKSLESSLATARELLMPASEIAAIEFEGLRAKVEGASDFYRTKGCGFTGDAKGDLKLEKDSAFAKGFWESKANPEKLLLAPKTIVCDWDDKNYVEGTFSNIEQVDGGRATVNAIDELLKLEFTENIVEKWEVDALKNRQKVLNQALESTSTALKKTSEGSTKPINQ